MTRHNKDVVQYITASVSVLSGILLAFLSFFLNKHNIEDSILWYIAQTFVYAGSIFGVSAYMNSKFGEIRSILTNNNLATDEQCDDIKLAHEQQKDRV